MIAPIWCAYCYFLLPEPAGIRTIACKTGHGIIRALSFKKNHGFFEYAVILAMVVCKFFALCAR
jgi:hypothetical protein